MDPNSGGRYTLSSGGALVRPALRRAGRMEGVVPRTVPRVMFVYPRGGRRRPPSHHRSARLVGGTVLAGLAMIAVSASWSGDAAAHPVGHDPVPRADAAGTVWLCRPGSANDPCAGDLTTTLVPASGPRTEVSAVPAAHSAFDCFYVYPTVSTQPSANANLTVQRAEIGAAEAQAARFSTVCRVWAPMYRQRTVASLALGLGNDPHADGVAYQSLLAGWNDYLKHFNDGRPIIVIGHSQGAAMLIRLLAAHVDADPAVRRRLVLAILAGGNVTVPVGQDVGATFKHLPLCTSTGQFGCVIAYSSFPGPPPADSLFGRPGQGVSLQSGQTATAGLAVACVNPAAVGGGTAALSPYFLTATMAPPPPAVSTPWVSYPDLYTARCQSAGGATWLQVTGAAGPRDNRPEVTQTLGPNWGYHLDDVNLALGNLVADVATAEAAYASGRS
jgi:hypothetical protein